MVKRAREMAKDDYVGLKPLEAVKKARDESRELRKNRYGNLDRAVTEGVLHVEQMKKECNCDWKNIGGVHKDTCPVLIYAKSKVR